MKHEKSINIGKGLLISFAILILAACSNITSPVKDADVGAETINASLETLAKLFAKAVSDVSVRQQIHQGVSARFDGDTNVLYQTLMATSQSRAIRQSLAKAQEGLSSQATTLDALASGVPRLQLAVPAHFDRWDASSYAPLVGFIPVGIDDASVKQIKAFDAKGQVHVLDARALPANPVIVLSQNERTDDAGNVLPAFSKGSGAALQAQSCIKNVYMEKVYLRDDHEPWWKGDPEVKLIAVSRNYDLSYHGSFLSVNDEGEWYNYHRLLGCTSADVVYYWYEDDGGGLDLTVSYKGFSLGIKIDDDDDFMGAIQVPYGYLNSTPTRWDLGDLVFYSN